MISNAETDSDTDIEDSSSFLVAASAATGRASHIAHFGLVLPVRLG
jgi:hypothetical protein